jgi:hypothetical protein
MGFMDKAKKLAEQAQQKIDETQKQFNQSQSGDQAEGGGVRYDEHGRPLEGSPGADGAQAAAPDVITPVDPGGSGGSAGSAEKDDRDERAGSGSGSGAPPDPFKPLQ